MRLEAYLDRATRKLKSSGISSARLDVLVLLEDELRRDRAELLAHPETELSATQTKKLNQQIGRRAKGEPLAYIRGFSEFYGRRFKVNRHVLEPRPESEIMIDLLKEIAGQIMSKIKRLKIADIGTGSGALGISAKLEIPDSEVDLFDIDASALAVAKHNCELHELHLRTAKRDLLRASHKTYDVILANLPYVPDGWPIDEAVAFEPKSAIFGGVDGLDVYRRFFSQLSHFSWRPQYILCEAMPSQQQKLTQIAANDGFKLHNSQDFIEVFK